MKRYMFDVDGVLTNFDLAFTTLAHKTYGTPISSTITQKTWNFRNILSAKDQSVIWDILKDTPQWWTSLESLISVQSFLRINDLCKDNEVYFITNRTHNLSSPGVQTQEWLIAYGITRNPRAIVTKDKGEACKVMNIDYSLEDNWGNACAIHWMSEGTKSFLINRRYNEKARGIIPEGIIQVDTVVDFLDRTE